MRDEEVTQGSQHGFPKGRLCLTNLVAFYNGVMTQWTKDGQLMSSTWTCARPLTMVPHHILISKLEGYGFEE